MFEGEKLQEPECSNSLSHFAQKVRSHFAQKVRLREEDQKLIDYMVRQISELGTKNELLELGTNHSTIMEKIQSISSQNILLVLENRRLKVLLAEKESDINRLVGRLKMSKVRRNKRPKMKARSTSAVGPSSAPSST